METDDINIRSNSYLATENPEEDELLVRASMLNDQPVGTIGTETRNSLLDQTCIDEDDDDKEFEDAKKEEKEDQN